jgi:peroxiredoxin
MRTLPLSVGEPAPWFRCRTPTLDDFVFHSVAGRYIVMAFFGSAADPVAAELLRQIDADRARFNDVDLSFFGVSIDPDDERLSRVANKLPGIRFFWDFDRAVSALYAAALPDGGYRPIVYVLDPALRVLAALKPDGRHNAYASLFALLDRVPKTAPAYVASVQAPVLVLPRIFEPALCETLIDYYGRSNPQDSGFMRDIGGVTTTVFDYRHKRRRDCLVADEALRKACMVRIYDRLAPEIHKAFQVRVTRMERYMVACYDSKEAAHFAPHRDNTTKGTAHRRFAVSLFLNTGAYDGGFLRFPEFGSALYAAPAGGAVVFSCSLLHEATTVTRGRRFMFLPFLYDEAGRAIREENVPYLEPDLQKGFE